MPPQQQPPQWQPQQPQWQLEQQQQMQQQQQQMQQQQQQQQLQQQQEQPQEQPQQQQEPEPLLPPPPAQEQNAGVQLSLDDIMARVDEKIRGAKLDKSAGDGGGAEESDGEDGAGPGMMDGMRPQDAATALLAEAEAFKREYPGAFELLLESAKQFLESGEQDQAGKAIADRIAAITGGVRPLWMYT